MFKTKIFQALCCLIFFFGTCSAFADQYDIKVMTAQVHQALQNRKDRYDAVEMLKSKGLVGENNRGYLETLNNPAAASAYVSAENADRQTIYNAIVEQNNLGPGGLTQVERVFAEVQRDRAKTGDSIQLPAGEWTKK